MKFIQIEIKQKNLGVQGYLPKKLFVNIDAVLAMTDIGDNSFNIVIKPQYLAAIKEETRISGRGEIEYIRTTAGSAKLLTQ